MTDYKLLAGIKISVFIPFANIAKISSTLKFVVLQYIIILLFFIPGSTICLLFAVLSLSQFQSPTSHHGPYSIPKS